MHRTARLTLAIAGLLWMGAALAQSDPGAANPPATSSASDQQAGPESGATSPTQPAPAGPPLPVPSPVAKGEKQAQPSDKHEAPAAVAAQGTGATPKEQGAAAAQVSSPAAPSGFRLMSLSTNALLSRVSLADQAKRTIDLQYFIFNNDATGRLIALHLLQAADRGVHVRMLIDDFNVKDDARMFKALDAHPNIEVRLFNPFRSSAGPGAVSKATEFVFEFERLNHRMHNKDFIVDNEVAIIGGRNIGDEYFDAKVDNNFRDLDVIAIGPVVPAAETSFEAYWNSDASHPIAEFASSPAAVARASATAAAAAENPPAPRAKGDSSIAADSKPPPPPISSEDPVAERAILEKNARTFEQSAYKAAAADDLPNGASADRPGNWYWGPASLIADQPEKIAAGKDRADLRISPQLKGMIQQAQSEVLVISPYFIPSANDDTNFVAVAQRGVAFKVLTNSLASSDELPAYNGYAEHRRKLLEGGVQLYELKPAPGVQMAATDAGQSSGVSLHAKSIVVDHRYVFIGSLNFDRRSKLLNTEMGVVVDSPQLAKAVDEFFQTATLPANAYHVVLGGADGADKSRLHWDYSDNGKDIDTPNEPGASLGRHLKKTLMKLLPVDGLL
jgi:putative cardiolipin synthase